MLTALLLVPALAGRPLWARRFDSLQRAAGLPVDAPVAQALIQLGQASQVKVRDFGELDCNDEALEEDQRRKYCESPYRHDGTWPTISYPGTGKVQAYLFTYALLAQAPEVLGDLFGAAVSLAGLQIVHTSLVFCQDAAEAPEAPVRFQKWCSGTGDATDPACWLNQQGENPCGEEDCSVNLETLKRLACVEAGFFEGWGIQVDQGKSLRFDQFNDHAPQVFWLGEVEPAAVDEALAKAASCAGGDFNPGTYAAISHNCHAFTMRVMETLALPSWSDTHALPAAVTPEVPSGTHLVGDVVDWVGAGPWPHSPDCPAEQA